MNRIEVKSNEYKISDLADELVFYTEELDDEIACSFFSKKLKKVALARNISNEQLKQLINEMNPNRIVEPELIRIQLIGGAAGSEKSKGYLTQFIETLKTIDNESDMINIVSYDTMERFHPNSLGIDCYHGGVIPL